MTQTPPSSSHPWRCLSCEAKLVLVFETTYQCPECQTWRRIAAWEKPITTLEAFL